MTTDSQTWISGPLCQSRMGRSPSRKLRLLKSLDPSSPQNVTKLSRALMSTPIRCDGSEPLLPVVLGKTGRSSIRCL